MKRNGYEGRFWRLFGIYLKKVDGGMWDLFYPAHHPECPKACFKVSGFGNPMSAIWWAAKYCLTQARLYATTNESEYLR